MQLHDCADSGLRSTLLLVGHLQALNNDTKMLIEDDTDTKFSKLRLSFGTNFLKPKPILFFRDQISETKTDNFFLRPNFPKPKPRLFTRPILPIRNGNPPKIGKSLETETETETYQYP